VTTLIAEPELDVFDAPAANWFVLRTKSRQEKTLSLDLEARGIAHFLPIVNVARYHGIRKSRVDVPMFPGYLFLRGDRDSAFEADRTRRVAQIIPVPDQARLNDELRNIAVALSRDVFLDIYSYLQTGIMVEVRAGPLRGVRGLVESRETRGRVVLNVHILGKAVSLEVDASLVDVIDDD
jgi:transcription antitermination factor NusG